MDASPVAGVSTRAAFGVSASIDDRLVYASGTLVLARPGRVRLDIDVGEEPAYPIVLDFTEDETDGRDVRVTPTDAGVEVTFKNWDKGSISTAKPIEVARFQGYQLLLSLSVHSIGQDKTTLSRVISYSFLRGTPDGPVARPD